MAIEKILDCAVSMNLIYHTTNNINVKINIAVVEYVKLDEFDIAAMCSKMRDYIQAIDFHPDCIVAILKGGSIPATNLANLLSIWDIHTIKIKKYDDDGKQIVEKAEIVDNITNSIKGKRVLIVDDVCETGESLKLAIEEIKKYTDTVMACVLVAKNNYHQINLEDVICPFAKTFKRGTWVRFYWENGY